MANPNDERQRMVAVTIDLTVEDRSRLDRVLRCCAADGDELNPSVVLLIGLEKLLDACSLRRINSQCRTLKMPLTKTQVEKYAECYGKLRSNVRDTDSGNPRQLSALEADDWLAERLKGAAQYGLTQDALEAVARWKYPGGALRKLVKENETRGFNVQEITKRSFDPATSDKQRIEKLRGLRGVDWPMASTILHFVFPECHPIMDVRAMRTVGGSTNFTLKKWMQYCELCRATATEYGLENLRILDRALWMYDYCHPRGCPSCATRGDTFYGDRRGANRSPGGDRHLDDPLKRQD